MEGNRIVCVGLDMYREWKEIELYVLVWACTENGRKQNCMCWFGHVQRMEGNRIVCVGLNMYREWKKIEFPKEYYI
jgi:hypothetical protein